MFELGSSLRDARERKRLTIADLEGVTKVRSKYLRALEDDDFATLPGPTYVKGFLRSYAEALGLDGQLYIDEYNSRYVTGDEETFIRPRRVPPPRRVRWVERNAVVLALAAIVVIGGVVIGAWRFVPDRSTAPVVQATAAPAAAEATGTAAPKVAATAPVRTVRLALTARRSTWIEVHETSSAGRLLFEGTLAPGQSQIFTAAARLWLNVGSPSAVTASVNGRTVVLPGAAKPKLMIATASGVSPLVAG